MSKSFKSFVKYAEQQNNDSHVTERLVDFLENEIECTVSDNVSFCFQFQDVLSGSVTCTNFCLYFQPWTVPNHYRRVPRRSTVIDEQFSIPLCSIESIFYSSVHQDLSKSASKKKYRPLTSALSSLDIVSCIKIYLKDFRVATLDMTKSQHAPNLANQLLFFSRVSSIEHVVQAGARLEWTQRVAFNSENCWRQEMTRVGAGPEWRVVGVSRELTQHSLMSYPMYVVVPRDTVAHDLSQMAEHWRSARFPVWVWSYANGSALLRSSTYDDNWIAASLNKKYLANILPVNRYGPSQEVFIDLSLSPAAIASSYKKLHKMCSIDSYELFAAREKDWLSRLGDSGWLRLVTSSLQTAAHVIPWMLDRGRSVVLYEEDGMDSSAVVSSLVQICCDPFFRTICGLDHLISKEWISLGHPFGQRILGVGTVPSAESSSEGAVPTTPTFLLFLDCLAQLIRLYPMQFGYSHHLLISLWDLSLTGCVPSFACSSVVEQLSSSKMGGPFPLSRFYSDDYRQLFSNVVNDAAQLLQKENATQRITGFSLGNTTRPMLCDVIRPPTTAVDIELWDECYLRFVPPASITNGGSIQRDIAIDEKMSTKANRGNMYWNSQFASLVNDVTEQPSSSFPYSLVEADALPSSLLMTSASQVDMSDAISEASFASLSVRDKSRASIPFDTPTRPARSNTSYTHRAGSISMSDTPDRLGPTPVRIGPTPENIGPTASRFGPSPNAPNVRTHISYENYRSEPPPQGKLLELRPLDQSASFTPVRPAPLPPPRKEHYIPRPMI